MSIDKFVLIYKYCASRLNKEIKQNNLTNEEIKYIKEQTKDDLILKKYIDVPNVFIHFSDLKRFGFNPQSIFDTPFGIYGYPLTSMLFSKISVFGTDRDYIHIFKANGKCLDIAKYTENDLQKDLEQLKSLYNISDHFISYAFDSARRRNSIGHFWNLTRLIGIDLGEKKSKTFESNNVKQDWKYNEKTKTHTKRDVQKLNINAFEWSKILQKLGYSWIIDSDAQGIIHKAEPYQGFVLVGNLNNFEHLATINKTNSKIFDLLSQDKKYTLQNSLQETIDINDFIEAFNQNNMKIVNKYKNKVIWEDISKYKYLSEKFMEKFEDKIDWNSISRYQKLSEEFIEKYQDKVNWKNISYYQKLSEEFIAKQQNKVNWEMISCNQKFSEEFVEKYCDKINWNYVFKHNNLLPIKFKQKYIKLYEKSEQNKPEGFVSKDDFNSFKNEILSKSAATKYKEQDISPEEKIEIEKNLDRNIISQYVDKPNTFIHFSNIKRFGFKPNYEGETPFGIYGYPLTTELATSIANFALDRKYIHIFECFGKELDIKKYSKSDLQRDLDILQSKYNIPKELIEEAKETAYKKTYGGYLWNITRLLSLNITKRNMFEANACDPFEWTKIFIALGYGFVTDKGSAIIHINEPYQAFCLVGKGQNNFKYITTVETTKSLLFSSLKGKPSKEQEEKELFKYDKFYTKYDMAINYIIDNIKRNNDFYKRINLDDSYVRELCFKALRKMKEFNDLMLFKQIYPDATDYLPFTMLTDQEKFDRIKKRNLFDFELIDGEKEEIMYFVYDNLDKLDEEKIGYVARAFKDKELMDLAQKELDNYFAKLD